MRILFVDDEPNILRSIRRILVRRPYKTYYAGSAREALDLLKIHEVDIVVTDMLMPGMNGYELLCKLKKEYPSITRVVLSGYARAELVQKAVIEGVAGVYLLKPLTIEKLAAVFERCMAIRGALKDKSVRRAVLSAGPLPVLSEQRKRIVDAIENDDDASRIAALIEADSIVTSGMLKLANSAFYGYSGKVGSVKDALVRVGLSATKGVMWTLSVLNVERMAPDARTLVQSIWRATARINCFYQFLYHRITGKKVPEAAGSMGLVHEVGLMLLATRMPGRMRVMAGRLKQEKKPVADIEKEIFGATHSQIGGYLLDHWDFPHLLISGALHHHEPTQAHFSSDGVTLMCCLHVTARYVWQRMPEGSRHSFPKDERAYAVLGHTEEDIAAVLGGEMKQGLQPAGEGRRQ